MEENKSNSDKQIKLAMIISLALISFKGFLLLQEHKGSSCVALEPVEEIHSVESLNKSKDPFKKEYPHSPVNSIAPF